MVAHWIDYIPWVYASIQMVITLLVSIIGAKYVRNEFLSQKHRVQQQIELAVNAESETIQNHYKPTITIKTESQAPVAYTSYIDYDTEIKEEEKDPLSQIQEQKSEEFKVCY